MKSLTKVKIINWHYFWDETVEIKPIVFLTGLNASGKSTFIDALGVILLGDTSGRNFNKAAIEKSNRTLKGYLRGEIGDTEEGNSTYLRNGRFTSYVACEFFDDLNKVYFTLGCVFDSYEDGTEEHHFFALNDKIPENEFVKEKTPMAYKDLNEYLKTNYADKFEFFDSNKAYQIGLKRYIGNLKDKYFTLLKKATSFIPITDITTFITEYVCDPQMNIEIGAMQDNILQYKSLENEANNMIERISQLEEINGMYKKYSDSKADMTLCSYLIEKSSHQMSMDTLASYTSSLESYKKRLLEIEIELAENESNKAGLNKKRIQLISDKANNDTYKLTEELYEEKKDLEGKISSLKGIKDDVESSIRNYANIYTSSSEQLIETFQKIDVDLLDPNHASEIVDISNSLREVDEKSKQILTTLEKGIEMLSAESLLSWKDSLFNFKQLISAFCVSFARTIKELENKVNVLNIEQNSLNSGVKSYDSNLNAIRNELRDKLSAKFNRDIDVSFFADLIDIDDKKWTNAIEGFLANQKFNIFVDSEYYKDAYNILKDLLIKYHYYGTALVDQEKLIARNFEALDGSLAEEIITDHKGASAYTNFLIGRLIKCDTIEEARSSGNGITVECDLYRNYTLTRINPRLYMNSFIGRKVGARQLQEKKEAIAETTMLISNYRALYRVANEANALEIINTNEINSIINDINSTYELSALNKSLDFVNEELAKHDTEQIDSFDRRISAIEEDIKTVEDDGKALLIEKGNVNASITNLKTDKIKEEENHIKEMVKHLETYDKEFVKNVGLPTFNKELESKKPIEIHNAYEMTMTRATYVIGNLFNQVKALRRAYIDRYHLAWVFDEESNDRYEKELTDIRDVKLPEYKVKIADSYDKATKQFKNDFISKLRSQIETVEDQIADLNQALQSSVFGDDSYRFTVKPNQTYKRYYDMFKDDLLLKQGEDDSEFITKYNDVMQDLFQQIVSDDANAKSNPDVLAGIAKFTDYRSYLDFDLIVTSKNGVEQRLSKMIKKKSGGETQTPFYISVLASFAQLYRVNEKGELGNTIRLIIFDEAFSKMDRGRIKESIRLLRKFNLQAILSAPSEKVGDISDEVDETLVVLHSNKSSSIRLYAKDKTN
jgi:uncharacterized protein YPO0396